jgi:hypothetical protein
MTYHFSVIAPLVEPWAVSPDDCTRLPWGEKADLRRGDVLRMRIYTLGFSMILLHNFVP